MNKIKSLKEYDDVYKDQYMIVQGNAAVVDKMNTLMRLYLIYQTWVPQNYSKDENGFDYNITCRIDNETKKTYLFINCFDRGIFTFPTRNEAQEFRDLFTEELLKIKDLI